MSKISKTEQKVIDTILKPIDNLIQDVSKHTDDGVDCLKSTRIDIEKNIEKRLIDIENRVRFFLTWYNKPPIKLKEDFPKLLDVFWREHSKTYIDYVSWLFKFCFVNRDLFFDDILKVFKKGKT